VAALFVYAVMLRGVGQPHPNSQPSQPLLPELRDAVRSSAHLVRAAAEAQEGRLLAELHNVQSHVSGLSAPLKGVRATLEAHTAQQAELLGGLQELRGQVAELQVLMQQLHRPSKTLSFEWNRSGVKSPIPAILHQSWRTIESVPAPYEPFVRSWITHHPDWKYAFWDDTDNRALIHSVVPQFTQLYERLSNISRADFARYALLYRFGGVYADIDFECVKSFEDLRHFVAFVGVEPRAHAFLLYGLDSLVCNALMASAPGHPFWMEIMEAIERKSATGLRGDATTLTGPKLVTQVFFTPTSTTKDLTMFGEDYFYPVVAKNTNLILKCRDPSPAHMPHCAFLKSHPRGFFTNNTHAVHHWQATWTPTGTPPGLTDLSLVVPPNQLLRPIRDGWVRLDPD
jgi:mannosyltransferase OCH1-like enzyme